MQNNNNKDVKCLNCESSNIQVQYANICGHVCRCGDCGVKFTLKDKQLSQVIRNKINGRELYAPEKYSVLNEVGGNYLAVRVDMPTALIPKSDCSVIPPEGGEGKQVEVHCLNCNSINTEMKFKGSHREIYRCLSCGNNFTLYDKALTSEPFNPSLTVTSAKEPHVHNWKMGFEGFICQCGEYRDSIDDIRDKSKLGTVTSAKVDKEAQAFTTQNNNVEWNSEGDPLYSYEQVKGFIERIKSLEAEVAKWRSKYVNETWD